VDSYLGTQKEALLQVAKTLSAVEEAKKVAMDRVEIALKDGSTQASEIKALTEENKVKIEANALALQTLSGNHLAHISSGIGDLNAKTDRMVEVLTTMGSDIKILVDRGLRG
jgi:chromosome condensin MukBEF complex kleisin-like MukF subunit